MKIKADKISRTQQIEKDYKVKLKRINYEGWLIYEIYDLNETLKAENAELKARLEKVKTPHEIGQILYFISKKLPAINLTTGGIEEMFEHSWEINKVKIDNIYIFKNNKGCLEYEYRDEDGNFIDFNTMYTSREAAENRLAELKEGK